MNIPSVLTPPFIYHDCSTRKTLWEEKFTPGEFTPVNMKDGGCRNVRKHRDIKDSDKFITLVILLEFCSLYKMIITSSKLKHYLGRTGRGWLPLWVSRTMQGQRKRKRQSMSILMSVWNISKITKDFEKLLFKSYERERNKHGPTDSYFCL